MLLPELSFGECPQLLLNDCEKVALCKILLLILFIVETGVVCVCSMQVTGRESLKERALKPVKIAESDADVSEFNSHRIPTETDKLINKCFISPASSL